MATATKSRKATTEIGTIDDAGNVTGKIRETSFIDPAALRQQLQAELENRSTEDVARLKQLDEARREYGEIVWRSARGQAIASDAQRLGELSRTEFPSGYRIDLARFDRDTGYASRYLELLSTKGQLPAMAQKLAEARDAVETCKERLKSAEAAASARFAEHFEASQAGARMDDLARIASHLFIDSLPADRAEGHPTPPIESGFAERRAAELVSVVRASER